MLSTFLLIFLLAGCVYTDNGWYDNNYYYSSCYYNPCYNNGECRYMTSTGSSYCVCQPGYYGKYCQFTSSSYCQNPCITNTGSTCQNNGVCLSYSCNSYQCVCLPNYTGTNCQSITNICAATRPCLNNGTCTNLIQNGYICTCPSGYTGLNCNILTNPCSSSPCQNNATCTMTSPGTFNSTGMFTCTCVNKTTGPLCDATLSPCAFTASYGGSTTCQNNGTCVDVTNNTVMTIGQRTYVTTLGVTNCSCTPGFTGPTCSIPINPCVNHACRNNGTCVATVNGNYTSNGVYTCSCRQGTTGSFCEAFLSPCNYVTQACRNGGLCNALTNNTLVADFNGLLYLTQLGVYTCNNCSTGYTGQYCECPSGICSSGYCLNGGTCSIQSTYWSCNYYCTCPTNYHGYNCGQFYG